MNRRDAFKMAAAAAAGSVARKLEVAPEQMNEEPDVPVIDMHEALRLQSAIELGDRTAEELGCPWGIRKDNGWPREDMNMWEARICGNPRFFYGNDPDPLTAVQKAREAALEWHNTHVPVEPPSANPTISIEWDEHGPTRFVVEPSPKPGLPDTTWRRLTIRGSGETP